MVLISRISRIWNPQRYLTFESQRLRPALDLLSQIHLDEHSDSTPHRILDLGCGTGNITPYLRDRWPQASILCLDSSNEMLDRARSNHKKRGLKNVEYLQSDFESFDSQEPFDLIYSNAALHWVGFDVHQFLIPRFMSMMNPGGVLAFQIPDTREQNSHLMMQQAMNELGFHKKVRWVTAEVDADQYHQLLAPICSGLNMWSTNYTHILEGDNPVVDFTGSTGLGPYVEALGGSTTTEGRAFMDKYRELILNAYPKQPNGVTLFNMKRFFVVAQK